MSNNGAKDMLVRKSELSFRSNVLEDNNERTSTNNNIRW